MKKTLEERFWEKVDKSGDCWVWTACKHQFGYGAINVNGVKREAHRVVWQLTHGSIPDGVFVCHRCDNPPCVRPDHLYLGDAAQNSADMKNRGRSAAGDRNGTRLHPEKVARGSQLPQGRKTHCKNGHPILFKQKCQICRRAASRRWSERNREAVLAQRRQYRMTPEAKAKSAEHQRQRREKDPEAYRAYMRDYYRRRQARLKAAKDV